MRRARDSDFGENGFELWGGYMAAKKAKLLDQFSEDANKEGSKQETTTIFQGISIFVNGYTAPSADELKRIMMLNGGKYHHYYSCKKTSFIIATNLADTKIKQLKGQPKVVKPMWIIECLKAGKLLDYRPFLLYSNQSKSQPKISFPAAESFSASSSKSNNHPLEVNKKPRFVPLNLEVNKIVKSSPRITEKQKVSVPESENHHQETLSLKTDNVSKSKLTEMLADDNSNQESNSRSSIEMEEPVQEEVEEVKINEKHITSISNEPKTNKPLQRMAKAGEPNFLSEFYSHSRLHHISTMGSMFKKYISDLRKSHNGIFSGKLKLLEWKEKQNISTKSNFYIASNDKIIMHIDMDCFFVSVGLKNHPELRGLPVAVTHAKGNPQSSRAGSDRAAEFEVYKQRLENKFAKNKLTDQTTEELVKQRMKWSAVDNSSMSEIASCSYEARKAGLKNGMFLGAALKLCPNLKTIPYDFEGYKEVSFMLYDTVASFTLDIEAVSCDEMFVDCTNFLRETNTPPLVFASYLRSEIKGKTGCPASTGFGGNILQARLATKKAKPDGQYHLLAEDVAAFMTNISVDDLPGVGRNLAYRLKNQHLLKCGDLQKVSLSRLQADFGQKIGLNLHRHCLGLDERELDLEHTRKSVSAEINYGIRFKEDSEAAGFIRELASEVQSRLEEISKQGRCITIKLMVKAKNAPKETAKFMGHGVCDNMSKSSTLTVPTSDHSIIAKEAITLLGQLAVPASSLRGMGIQVSKLTDKSSKDRSLNNFIVRGKKAPTAVQNTSEEITITKVNEKIDQPGPSHAGMIYSFPSTSKSLERPSGPSTSKSEDFSELDKDFLAALPADIREEVIQDYKNSKQVKLEESNSERTETAPQSLQATENITFSQIDPSFLEALPEDLRAEVMNNLQNSARPQSPPPASLQSPGKTTPVVSPTKSVVISPRKGKYSPRSKHKQNLLKGQQKINILLKSPSKSKEILEVSPESENPVALIDVDVREEEEEETGVLNPKMSLLEALQLVREWVDTQSSPQDIDREVICTFLQQLVKLKRVDKVQAILRTLHRKIEAENNEWKNAYLQIVNDIQDTMMVHYGAKLKVQWTC